MVNKVAPPPTDFEKENIKLRKEKQQLESKILDLQNKVLKAENKALKFEQKNIELKAEITKFKNVPQSFFPIDLGKYK